MMGNETKKPDRCTYCGETVCQVCCSRVQMDVMRLVDRLEQLLIKPDGYDGFRIINNHLRAAWGLRDALNDYFNSNCDRAVLDKLLGLSDD